MAKLLTLLRFRLHLIRLALRMAPITGASDEPEAETEAEEAEDTEEEETEESGSEETEDDKPKAGSAAEPDWKRMARKHEREAKKARKEREQLEQRLKAREDADKSEQEKAIEEAEQRARKDLEGKFEKERKQDRLEVAATKIAAKGVQVGSGDDAKTVRFADPDDALIYLERDISSGELDAEDLFDEKGKVRSDRLDEALVDLLSRKPHLAAGDAKPKKVAGTADGGKGDAPEAESSVEDQLKKVRRSRPSSQQKILVGRQAG